MRMLIISMMIFKDVTCVNSIDFELDLKRDIETGVVSKRMQ